MLKNQPRFKFYLLFLDIFLLLFSFLLTLILMPGPLHQWTGQSLGCILNCLSSYIFFSLIIVVIFFFQQSL